jgi:3-oxoacyl-[acyl-carrier protein] reductase
VLKRFGGLSVLVNNAGVQTWGPFLGVSEDDWDLVIDTNLKGTFVRLVTECLALLHV